MWALRRASSRLGNHGLSSGTGRIICAKPDIAKTFSKHYHTGVIEPREKIFDGFLTSTSFLNTSSAFPKSARKIHSFSSQAGAKSSKEDDDDLDDDFSKLETSIASVHGEDGDLANSDLSGEEDETMDEMQNELEALGDVSDKNSPRTKASSPMTEAILGSPTVPLRKVLNKWVEEGNEVNQIEATLTMLHLRRRRMFSKAFELSEWLEEKKLYKFSESCYASRVDLIAKNHGIFKAEDYITRIPESFRGERVYRTLLANCVSGTHIKKAEETFNKMRTMGLPLTCFSCNQLLLIYKFKDRTKVADILLLMKKQNIKPNAFTYKVLIDIKGESNNIPAMEQVAALMEADGIKPNTQIQVSMARHYAANGFRDKAEAILKELEGEGLEKNPWACQWLMPIYASLGRDDQVERIWKSCQDEPRVLECTAAVQAWGQLGRVEKAEEAFEKLSRKVKEPNGKQFTTLLRVYTKHGMLAKGKDLMSRMGKDGFPLGPMTWDAIVKLYIGAGEVEMADSVLAKAVGQRRVGGDRRRPLFSTYLAIMEGYSGRGDVRNAEKILVAMRQAGYPSRLSQYRALVEAYAKAGLPAYGMRERLKGEKIFLNRELAAQLAKVEAFKRTPLSDLLE